MARPAYRPCYWGVLLCVRIFNLLRELKPRASRPGAKHGKNRLCAWEAKPPSLTAALSHCQAGRTGQEGRQAGLGKKKKIVYSAGLTGSAVHLGPTLRLCIATVSRRQRERN